MADVVHAHREGKLSNGQGGWIDDPRTWARAFLMQRTYAALIALAAAAACGAGAAPSPVPTPSPSPPAIERTARAADSVRADSARAEAARRAAAATRVATPALPRAASRTDTLPARELRGPVRVCAGGDVTLGTNLDTAWTRVASARLRTRFGQRDDPSSLLAPLRPLVADADLVLVNVESAIGAGRVPSKCSARSTNCFAFRAPPSSAPALRNLRAAGTVIGNIANNHARDAGSDGRDSTIAALERAGVVVTGADSVATPVRTRAGDTIGVLGFYTSDSTPDARDTARGAPARRACVRQVSGGDRYDAPRSGGAGCAAHVGCGERFLGIDRGNPVAFADAAVRGGAALVIGHGPHVLRAIEWRERGALIAYSLGNLVTYGPFRSVSRRIVGQCCARRSMRTDGRATPSFARRTSSRRA